MAHTGVIALCVTSALLLVLLLRPAEASCDEAICASLVSKCLLMKSCECDMTDKKNCTCCQQCHRCLSRLYTECCSCVGMCPDRSTDTGMMRSSTVDVLMDPIPELFEVLTEEEDPMLRWTTYTYPAHLDLLYFKPQDAELEFGLEDTYSAATELSSAGMNCTVAYMSQCVSLKRCRDSCGSMGASRYRWFHQYGCCECIGSTCLDYGKGEPLCLKCPLPDNEEEYEDYYYYDSHEHDKYQGEMGDGEFDADGEVNLASDPS